MNLKGKLNYGIDTMELFQESKIFIFEFVDWMNFLVFFYVTLPIIKVKFIFLPFLSADSLNLPAQEDPSLRD